jgi:hypothetical protein
MQQERAQFILIRAGDIRSNLKNNEYFHHIPGIESLFEYQFFSIEILYAQFF